jgi:hypothetical protein
MLSIQQDFCHIQNNWKLRTGKSQTSVSSKITQKVSLKKLAPTGKICFEWSSNLKFQVGNPGLFLELQLEDHWRSGFNLVFSPEFPVVSKAP